MSKSYVVFYKTEELVGRRRFWAEVYDDINEALKRKEQLQAIEGITQVSVKEGGV